jgi:hypothetical protein
MTHQDTHTPTPEFRAQLESEVSRALRHEQRVAATRWDRWPSVRTVARLAAAIVIGAVVGAAPAQVADARQRDSLLLVARAEERITAMRYEIAKEEYARLTRLYETGVVTQRELVAAERERRLLEVRLEALHLSMQETQATSTAPRNDLGAPVVGERDFVKARLMLDLRAAEFELRAAERAAEETQRRVEVGAETQRAGLGAQEALARARANLDLVAGKLKLRDDFVAGRAPATELQNLLRALELNQRFIEVRARLTVAEQRLKTVNDQVATGVATRREALLAELELTELRSELELLELQLRQLRTSGR